MEEKARGKNLLVQNDAAKGCVNISLKSLNNLTKMKKKPFLS